MRRGEPLLSREKMREEKRSCVFHYLPHALLFIGQGE
jgi:hypothetical protein